MVIIQYQYLRGGNRLEEMGGIRFVWIIQIKTRQREEVMAGYQVDSKLSGHLMTRTSVEKTTRTVSIQ